MYVITFSPMIMPIVSLETAMTAPDKAMYVSGTTPEFMEGS